MEPQCRRTCTTDSTHPMSSGVLCASGTCWRYQRWKHEQGREPSTSGQRVGLLSERSAAQLEEIVNRESRIILKWHVKDSYDLANSRNLHPISALVSRFGTRDCFRKNRNQSGITITNKAIKRGDGATTWRRGSYRTSQRTQAASSHEAHSWLAWSQGLSTN